MQQIDPSKLTTIEAGPDDYRKQDLHGRWRAPDTPKVYRNMFFGVVVILALIFWKRDELSSGTLFGLATMFGFGAGGLFAIWLKDVD